MTYPSDLVPAPPRVVLEVPDGWEQVAVPQTLLAIRESAPAPGSFATNIVIRLVQRPAAVTEEVVIGELAAYVTAQPEGVMGEPYELTIHDRVYAAADLSFLDEAGRSLAQQHLFTGEIRGPLVSIVQVAATFGGTRTEEAARTVRDVLRTLQIHRQE